METVGEQLCCMYNICPYYIEEEDSNIKYDHANSTCTLTYDFKAPLTFDPA